MSYCRFSEGDVYMYFSVHGFIDCCGCHFSYESQVKFFTYESAINHLKEHKQEGHELPNRALKRLEQEGKEYGMTKEFSLCADHLERLDVDPRR